MKLHVVLVVMGAPKKYKWRVTAIHSGSTARRCSYSARLWAALGHGSFTNGSLACDAPRFLPQPGSKLGDPINHHPSHKKQKDLHIWTKNIVHEEILVRSLVLAQAAARHLGHLVQFGNTAALFHTVRGQDIARPGICLLNP